MTILELAESFKTMNRPNPARPESTVTLFGGSFLGNVQKIDRDVKFDTIYMQVSKFCN